MKNICLDGAERVVGAYGNVIPAIEWQDDSVCFADGQQWVVNKESNNLQYPLSNVNQDSSAAFDYVLGREDFQLNTIKQGDYIEASELDTEQKYNDAVEVFGLFGFEFKVGAVNEYSDFGSGESLTCCDDGLWQTSTDRWNKRKKTFNQLMAIGELKRLEIERNRSMGGPVSLENMFVRDKEPQFGKNEDGSMKLIKSNFSEKPNSCEGEWTDKHYDFNYQLTKEDIGKGHVRVDAYFVNRMWKINQWDDTGAAFHVLKTLPRISNNKNPLKRELVALKKQVDLLCKMHGVDDENTN